MASEQPESGWPPDHHLLCNGLLCNNHECADIGVEEDVFESYYDPFDIDDGEEVETSKAYETLDQCMKTEIDGIIGRLSKDERIQRLLGQKEKPKTAYDKKIGSRQKGVKRKLILLKITFCLVRSLISNLK